MRNLVFGENRSEKLSLSSSKGFMPAVLAALFLLTLFPIGVHSAEKLLVKDAGGTAAFSVEDNGRVFAADRYDAQSRYPGFWLDETGTGHKGAYFVLGENWMQVQRRAQNFGGYEASPVFINIGAPHAALVIDQTGYAGFGKWGPSYPLHMGSGAYCTAGGVWTNASSREYKKDIKELTRDEAMETLNGLNPVKFAYKSDSSEQHVGFIAEDVPELVATKDKKGTSSMDMVAVLTKVVQEQQKTIAELSKKMGDLEKELKAKDKVAMATTN